MPPASPCVARPAPGGLAGRRLRAAPTDEPLDRGRPRRVAPAPAGRRLGRAARRRRRPTPPTSTAGAGGRSLPRPATTAAERIILVDHDTGWARLPPSPSGACAAARIAAPGLPPDALKPGADMLIVSDGRPRRGRRGAVAREVARLNGLGRRDRAGRRCSRCADGRDGGAARSSTAGRATDGMRRDDAGARLAAAAHPVPRSRTGSSCGSAAALGVAGVFRFSRPGGVAAVAAMSDGAAAVDRHPGQERGGDHPRARRRDRRRHARVDYAWEALWVDDGSTDRSLALLQALPRAAPLDQLRSQPRPVGGLRRRLPPRARRVGRHPRRRRPERSRRHSAAAGAPPAASGADMVNGYRATRPDSVVQQRWARSSATGCAPG